MPAVALSRVGARVVESGPGGPDRAARGWQRLEALPDPRSPQGRIYPLACLIAIALCAFTAAGNDRFTAVGQWIRRASQADLGRLRARGTRSPAGTGRRMRRRSGWCWTVLTRGPDPGPARPAPAQPPASRRAALGQRARLPGPARCPASENTGPRPVKGSSRGRQDLPRSTPRRWHPGSPPRCRRTRRAPPGSP